ncbi:hypothetical protein C8R45DRAFT_995521 [Mycena sanguinolenta]|nr:hypothetical protein C8R45DRAFT_995521 [Mycena sanguinolenta]
MSLSMLEVLSILRPLERNMARLNYSRSHAPNSDVNDDLLHNWLDGLAWLLAGASSKMQGCAVSLTLLQKCCTITIAYDSTPVRIEEPPNLVHSIWNWMKDASALPQEDANKNAELCDMVLNASQNKIRRRIKEKGQWVEPLLDIAEKADLTDSQRAFLLEAKLLQVDLRQRLLDIENFDLHMASKALRHRARNYEAAKSLLESSHWLFPFESQVMKAGAKWPSLLRYFDKLLKPYRQYGLIRKAAKKSFIRNALSIPLRVIVLPSPAPDRVFASNMVDFEPRVRAYLKDALLSHSEDARNDPFAVDAIDSFWSNIKTAVDGRGQLAPLLPPHCECALLCHHLDLSLEPITSSTEERGAPYPYLGVSNRSCFQCALYFKAYAACDLGPAFKTRSSHGRVSSCAVPVPTNPLANPAIANDMAAQIKRIIGQLLAADTDQRCMLAMLTADCEADAARASFIR